MRRREFIALVGGAAAGWPRSAGAQQTKRIRRIGVLAALAERDPEPRAWVAAFQDGLQRLGWEHNRNISIDYRWAGGEEHLLKTYSVELVGMAPDVLFAAGPPALVALMRETRSLPIVFVQVPDPVKLGFVANLARPGGNVTGFTNFEHAVAGKWLELLNDTAPGTTRVAVIFDSENPSQSPYLRALEAAAPSFGVRLTLADVRNTAEVESAIDAFAQQPKGALIVAPNTFTVGHRDLIIALAARHHLPAVYPYRAFTSDGGLMSYGADLPDLYRRAASYVDLILKGTRPGDLPVQLPTKFELVINLKAAKALGITIPANILGRADEVIE